MKLLATLLLVLTATNAKFLVFSEQDFSQLDYANKVVYNVWNGFVRGFYREHLQTVVNQACFGEWIGNNLTHLDDVVERLSRFQFDVTYNEAKEAAVDAVNLLYKNREFCDFDKVYEDAYKYCTVGESKCRLDSIFLNLQKNVF